jgi:hypothetical protein
MTRPRNLVLASGALLLAGCFGGPPPAPLPVAQLKAGFPPGGVANVIEVDVADRLPLHSAELVAPDGAATPASSVEAADAPLFGAGQYVGDSPWKLGVAGGPGRLAIASGQPGATLRSENQLLTIVSSASIPLPDPVAYRKDWQHYRIRLGFGVPPGEVETREIAAPEPPPPAPGPPAS